jgi:hypothetical protein
VGKPQRLLSTLRTHLLQMLTSWSSVPTHLRCRTANSANGMMEHSSCVACLRGVAESGIPKDFQSFVSVVFSNKFSLSV